MKQFKIKTCNCFVCRKEKRKRRKLYKLYTRLFNKRIRRKGKEMCKDENKTFDFKQGFYWD